MTSNSIKERPHINRRYSLLANHGNSISLEKSLNPSFSITRSPSIVPSSISSTPKRELYNKQKTNEQKPSLVPLGYDEDPVETHDQVVRKLSLLHNFPSTQEINKIVDLSNPVREEEDEHYNNMDSEQLKEELKRIKREKNWMEAKNSTLESYYLQAISTNAHSQMTLDQVRGRSRYRKDAKDNNSSTSSSNQLKGSISNHNFMIPPMPRSRSGSIGLTDNSSFEDTKVTSLHLPSLPRIMFKRQLSDRSQTINSYSTSKWSSNRELFSRKTSEQLDSSLAFLESRDQFRFKSDDLEGRLTEVEKRIDHYITHYMKRNLRVVPEQIKKDYSSLCRLQETFSALKEEVNSDEYLADRKAHILYRINVSMNDAFKLLSDTMKKNGIRLDTMGSVLSLACSASQMNIDPNVNENISSISSISNTTSSQEYPDLYQHKNNLQILEQYFESYIDRYKKMTGLPSSRERDRRIEKVKEQLLLISKLVHPTTKFTTIVPEDNLKMYFLTWEKKNMIASDDDVDEGKLEKIIQEHLSKIKISDTNQPDVNNTRNSPPIGAPGNLRSGDSFTFSTTGTNGFDGDSGLGDHSKVPDDHNQPGLFCKPIHSTPEHKQKYSNASLRESPDNFKSYHDYRKNPDEDSRHISQNMLRTFEQEPDSSTISQESRISLYLRETNTPKQTVIPEDTIQINKNNNNIYESELRTESHFESPFKVPELPRNENSMSSLNGLKKQNSFSPSKLNRGISLRSQEYNFREGQSLPVEHQISPLNSIRQTATSNSLSNSTNFDGENNHPCINDRFCKLWILRVLKNYNRLPRSEVKDHILQNDFECLAKEICGYCDGYLSDDLNYSQHRDKSKEDKVVRNGASESPLVEMFDIKPIQSQPPILTMTNPTIRHDDSNINNNNDSSNHIQTHPDITHKSVNEILKPKISGEEPGRSINMTRMPFRKYFPNNSNSNVNKNTLGESFKTSYLMKEYNPASTLADTINNNRHTDHVSLSQKTTNSLFPSQSSLTPDEKSSDSINYRRIDYLSSSNNSKNRDYGHYNQSDQPHDPLTNVHYSSDDMRVNSVHTNRPQLIHRKSLRPPSIYEGVNDAKTLNRIYRTVPRSRSTNQLEIYASASTSNSSASSPGISQPSSRYSKILSDAQTTTMLAQDLHKTLLSVKPL